mmetsp:Transcript_11244/g.29933  ORF Transcript_11244/g.29933 Transcript_11244/m.29933 type:complete len:264 (+) Transcript_11244:2-793(+)
MVLLQELHRVERVVLLGGPLADRPAAGRRLLVAEVAVHVLPLLQRLVVEEAVHAVLHAAPRRQSLVVGPRVLHAGRQNVGPHDGAAPPRHDLHADFGEERLAAGTLGKVVEVDEDGLRPESTIVVAVEELARPVPDHVEPLEVLDVHAGEVGQPVFQVLHFRRMGRAQHARKRRPILGGHVGQVLHLVVCLVHAGPDDRRDPELLGELQEVLDLPVAQEVGDDGDRGLLVDDVRLQNLGEACSLVQLGGSIIPGHLPRVDGVD